MKKFFALVCVMAFFTVTLPSVIFRNHADSDKAKSGKSEPGVTVVNVGSRIDDEESIQVFSHKENKTMQMSMPDYIIGVVAAEMPAEYEPEALKAQALAAMSYARYRQQNQNAAVSTDSNTSQGYRTVEEMRSAWGDRFDENYQKIKEAVMAVNGLSLEYDGQPVLAAYFAVSAGKTENAADIWGREYPYLVSVNSDGDLLSPGYRNETAVSAEELVAALKKIREVQPTGEPADYIGESHRTDAGTVTSIEICGVNFSGGEVRRALGLPSAAFSAEWSDGNFVFTCEGYGHGVGMSQYGADYMARQGANFKEILLHYYPGSVIVG